MLAREMAAGRVEELRVPSNCLDVLAQQIVAMTAMEDWAVADLCRPGSPGLSLSRSDAAGLERCWKWSAAVIALTAASGG